MSRKNRSLKKRGKKFIMDVVIHTPVIKMTFLLVTLWMLFSAGIFFGDSGNRWLELVVIIRRYDNNDDQKTGKNDTCQDT